jgi:hypothetical protein
MSFYNNFTQNYHIEHKFNTEILEQKIVSRKGKIDNEQYFLVMDGCLDNNHSFINKNKVFQDIIYNGRNCNIPYILSISTDTAKHIRISMRENLEYVFLFENYSSSMIKKIYEHYGGFFDTFEEFKNIYIKLTEKYGCMVIFNVKQNTTIKDKVFYYRVHDLSQTI